MSDIICDHCGADQDMSEWVNQRTKNEENCIVVCPECHQDTGTVLDVIVEYGSKHDTYRRTPTGREVVK